MVASTTAAERRVIHERTFNPKPSSIIPIAALLKIESGYQNFIIQKDLSFVPLIGPNTESHILTESVRHTANDVTGLFPYFIGVAHNKEEALMYMMPAATNALNWLKAQRKDEKDVYDETINALLYKGPWSIDILDRLDKMWEIIVNKVKGTASDMCLGLAEYNGMTPEAWMFREKNVAALNLLKERHSLKELAGRYLKIEEGGSMVVDVIEGPSLPVVPEDQVAILLKILPDLFNKEIVTPEGLLNTEAQILWELGPIAGNDLIRKIIDIMTEKQVSQMWSQHDSSLP